MTSLVKKVLAGVAGVALLSSGAIAQGAQPSGPSASAPINHKTYVVPAHEVLGDGKGTTVYNIVVTIEQGASPYAVAYSLDYDYYNHGEGDKAGSSSNTVLLFDFLGTDGYPLPAASITSTDFRHTCTYPAQHRHETGRLVADYATFIAQVQGVRVRDTGIQGYSGGC